MKYDIFISYRREGGYDTAKHLNDLLVRDGYKVSFDIDTLRSGDFDTQLLSRIDQCKDFILIVDQHAFERTLDPNFDPKKDWLRSELAYALKKGKNVIPIFLAGVNGFPDNLPSDVAEITMKNGPEYNRYHFNAFYKDLKKRFIISRSSRYIFRILGIITICALLLLTVFFLKNPKTQVRHTDNEIRDTIINTRITSSIDSTKYYWDEFDDKNLFIKGLKHGVFYDAGKDTHYEGVNYQYKCGRLFDIQSYFFDQTVLWIDFYATNEDGVRSLICNYFGNIGLDSSTGFDDEHDIYRDNQYVIGQYDFDNDNIDELIIAVRTTKDITFDNVGIGINIFKLINDEWKEVAHVYEWTNALPAVAKIIKNNIYVTQMRTDQKYVFTGDSLVFDDNFYGTVFDDSDF